MSAVSFQQSVKGLGTENGKLCWYCSVCSQRGCAIAPAIAQTNQPEQKESEGQRNAG
jgi:hypothetical protein